MKTKLIVTFTFISFYCQTAISQYLDQIHLKDIKSQYIIVSPKTIMFSDKITIVADFGKINPNSNKQKCILKNEKNKPINFNSIVDALNFFYEYDYECINTYSQLDIHFVLKKKNKSNEK